jgi:2,3-bisphosphoglycerate-independent phosphoglycerate mutase
MSAFELTDALIPELEKRAVDFVCLNFANGDMVGHTEL